MLWSYLVFHPASVLPIHAHRVHFVWVIENNHLTLTASHDVSPSVCPSVVLRSIRPSLLTVFPSWQIISNLVCATLSSQTPSDSCELWASSVNARAVGANNLARGQPPSGDKPADSAAWRGPAPLGLSPTCVHRPLQSLMWWACESSCITLALTPF